MQRNASHYSFLGFVAKHRGSDHVSRYVLGEGFSYVAKRCLSDHFSRCVVSDGFDNCVAKKAQLLSATRYVIWGFQQLCCHRREHRSVALTTYARHKVRALGLQQLYVAVEESPAVWV